MRHKLSTGKNIEISFDHKYKQVPIRNPKTLERLRKEKDDKEQIVYTGRLCDGEGNLINQDHLPYAEVIDDDDNLLDDEQLIHGSVYDNNGQIICSDVNIAVPTVLTEKLPTEKKPYKTIMKIRNMDTNVQMEFWAQVHEADNFSREQGRRHAWTRMTHQPDISEFLTKEERRELFFAVFPKYDPNNVGETSVDFDGMLNDIEAYIHKLEGELKAYKEKYGEIDCNTETKGGFTPKVEESMWSKVCQMIGI